MYSINQVIKKKHILLELKVPWPMSAISESYNRTHNILELEDVLPKNSQYELTDEFPNDVRLNSKLHGIKV